MQMPSVVHPKRISLNEILFEIVSFVPLTDAQALHAANYFYNTHKFTKKDKGKLFKVITTFDDSTSKLL